MGNRQGCYSDQLVPWGISDSQGSSPMLRPHYREQGTRGLSGCGVKTQTTSDIPRKSRFVRGDTGIYFSDTTSKVLGILEMAGKGSREGKEVEMGQDGSVLQTKQSQKQQWKSLASTARKQQAAHLVFILSTTAIQAEIGRIPWWSVSLGKETE